MLRFLLRRLLHVAGVVGVATLASFALLRLAPGDPVIPGAEDAREGAAGRAAILRARHGLDRPLAAQLAAHAARVARGDLGTSLVEGRPVRTMLVEALPPTLLLAGTGLVLAVVLGVGVALLQARHPDDARVGCVGATLTALYALPEFVVAVALIAVLALRLGLLPVGGMGDPLLADGAALAEHWRDRARHLALPALTLALSWSAAVARQQRAALADAACDDHVRTARAKGAPEWRVWTWHALPPTLPVTAAVVGVMLPALAGGALAVEALFSWPGMGALLLRGVASRDYPLVAGGVVLVSATTALGTLLADLAARAADPRLRGSGVGEGGGR